MNETKRLIRYVTPGFLFIIELSLFLFLADPHNFIKLGNLLVKIEIGSALIAIIGSGGLGFVFSIVHHCLYWRLYAKRITSLVSNQKEMLVNAESQRILTLYCEGGKQISANRLSIAGAWRVISAIWYGRVRVSQRIEGAIQRTESLSDLMHGTGTALIACLAAVFFSIIILGSSLYKFSNNWLIVVYIASVVLLITIHFLNYWMVVKHTQGVINTVSLEEFYDTKYPRPIIAFVTQDELNSKNSAK